MVYSRDACRHVDTEVTGQWQAQVLDPPGFAIEVWAIRRNGQQVMHRYRQQETDHENR